MERESGQRLAYLDGLRLVAAAAVLAQHLFERFHEPWARALIEPAPGVFGVVLFFMVSGFVIPHSVRQPIDIRSFFIRRLFRIYPLYLATLALVLLWGVLGIAPYFSRALHAGAAQWIANLLLVQDFVRVPAFYSVTWTLAIEFIWYGLFIALLKAAASRAGAIAGVTAPLAMIALTLLSLAVDQRIPLGRPGLIYAAVLGYQAYRRQHGEISRRAWGINVLAFLIVTNISNIVAFGIFHHPNITMLQAMGPWTAALILFTAVLEWPALRTGLANSLLTRLGAASYSIYMMHSMAIGVAVHLRSAILVIPAAILLTWAMSLATYRYVERPGIALGRRLARRGVRAPTPDTVLAC